MLETLEARSEDVVLPTPPENVPRGFVVGIYDRVLAEQDLSGHPTFPAESPDKLRTDYKSYKWKTVREEGPRWWRRRNPIAKGAMAEVFEAYDAKLDTVVMIKQPSSTMPGVWENFEREAKTLAMLQHPGVAKVYEVFIYPNKPPVMIMEKLEGECLREAIYTREWDNPARLQVLKDLCETVDYMASQGIFHRDLKPGNIVLDKDFKRARLIDFGVATSAMPQVTEDGLCVGTPNYMAPEVRWGSPSTLKSEVFALASVAYKLYTGVSPQYNNERQKAQFDYRRLPSKMRPVFKKALSDRPRKRYTTAMEFFNALEEVS